MIRGLVFNYENSFSTRQHALPIVPPAGRTAADWFQRDEDPRAHLRAKCFLETKLSRAGGRCIAAHESRGSESSDRFDSFPFLRIIPRIREHATQAFPPAFRRWKPQFRPRKMKRLYTNTNPRVKQYRTGGGVLNNLSHYPNRGSGSVSGLPTKRPDVSKPENKIVKHLANSRAAGYSSLWPTYKQSLEPQARDRVGAPARGGVIAGGHHQQILVERNPATPVFGAVAWK